MSRGYDIDGLGEDVALGKGGPRIVRNGQLVEHRDNGGALTRTKGAAGVDADDYATVSQVGGGGASFGVFNPLVAPATPNPLDVESWTDLPADWSAWTPGAGALPQTRSVDRGAMVLDIGTKAANSGPACTGIYRPVPAASQWAAYARMSILSPRTATGVFLECGFGIARDLDVLPDISWVRAADVFVEDANALQSAPRALGLTNYASGTSPISGAPVAYQFAGSFWFRVRKTNPADTWSFAADYSTDGIRWQPLHTGASFAAPAAPADLVLYARSTPSTTTSAPAFRVVVGPVRFANGNGSNNLTSLIPAGN